MSDGTWDGDPLGPKNRSAKDKELAELRLQLSSEQQAVARLHAENQRLREYIDIFGDVLAWLIIAAGFPTVEAIADGIGKERYARLCTLKAELFPEGKK